MFQKEIDTIFHILQSNLSANAWNGKECIKEMRESNYAHWRQMEWPGFYFQFKCETLLSQNKLMNIPALNLITLNLMVVAIFLGISKHTVLIRIKLIAKESLQTVTKKR